MKILFITDNFVPEVNAPASRTYDHCKRWVEMGEDVTVVTCAPNFPLGKVYKGYKNRIYQREIVSGIKVIRVWSFISANSGKLKRIIDFLSFTFSSFIYLFLRKKFYDVIIATSPQFFTGFAAMGIARIKRVPWIFEVRDLWPEGIIFLKKDSGVYKLLELIEKKYYKSSAGIVTVTQSFKNNIERRCNVCEKKICVVYNGSNRNLFNEKPKNAELLKSLNLSGKFIIGYAGTLGISHSLDFILSCLNVIYSMNEKIHFLFIGSGAVEQKMKMMAEEYEIKNMTLLSSVPKENVSDFISLFDVGLVPLKKCDAYLKVIPSKIFELAAMRKPILLGVNGEARTILEENNAGVYYEPENREDFIFKVNSLYSNRDNLQKYIPGLDYISESFDRNLLAERMLFFIKKTVNEDSSIRYKE
ncbi:MAG: glycosyltransferase family 4 protein [Bacteroidales bacterium]|jgi:glycosyltransferase involved in cell wall biosynthesis|nr:glycosyltransferase family 4 protein [Bacteroidales bacterium]